MVHQPPAHRAPEPPDAEPLATLTRLLREAEAIADPHRSPVSLPSPPTYDEVVADAPAWPLPPPPGDPLPGDWEEQITAVRAAHAAALEAEIARLGDAVHAAASEQMAVVRADLDRVTEMTATARALADGLEADATAAWTTALTDACASRDTEAERLDAELARLRATHLSPVGAELGAVTAAARTTGPLLEGGRRPVLALGSRPDGSTLWVPSASNLVFLGDEEATRRAAWAAAVKQLFSAPPALARLRFCDPVQLGHSLGPLFALLEADELTGGAPACTEAEIAAVLDWARSRVRDLAAHALRGTHESLDAFNATTERPEYTTFLVAFGVGPSWGRRNLEALVNLAAMGPTAGVCLIATVDGRHPRELAELTARFAEAPATAVLTRCGMSGQGVSADAGDALVDLAAVASSAEADARAALEEFAAAADATRRVVREALVPRLAVPIGWGASAEVSFTLGNKAAHALVVGRTGSGKSTLLHTLIHNAALRYGPDELELWLIDLKEGVEFTQYASPDSFPQVRVVGQAAEPELGMRVLKALVEEGKRRGALFRPFGVTELEDYRAASGEELPAVLCIIDECHLILKDGQAAGWITAGAWAAVEWLAKEGRAFGLHLVLSTQSLRGMGVRGGEHAGAWAQIAQRVAMRCADEDAALVFREDNRGAVGLQIGQAVLNDEEGRPGANQTVDVTYLDSNARAAARAEARRRWERRAPLVVLTTDRLPTWTPPPLAESGPGDDLRFSLGTPMSLEERLWVEAPPETTVGVFGPPVATTATLWYAALELRAQSPSLAIIAPRLHAAADALAARCDARRLALEELDDFVDEPEVAEVVLVIDADRWRPPPGVASHRLADAALGRVVTAPRRLTIATWAAVPEVARLLGSPARDRFSVHVTADGALAAAGRGQVESFPPHYGFPQAAGFQPWAPPPLAGEEPA